MVKLLTLISEIEEDGKVRLPKEVMEQLHLKAGMRVKLSIEYMESEEREKWAFSELSICGMWADREDMKDSAEWVKALRSQEEKRLKEMGLG